MNIGNENLPEDIQELLDEAAKDYEEHQALAEKYNYEIGFTGNNHGFTEDGTTTEE